MILLEAMHENQRIEKANIEDGNQSLITQSFRSDIWRHRWVRIITYICIVGVLVLLMVPIAMKHYLQSWLLKNGADHAVVRNIDFNPFVGSLRLQNLDVKIADRTVMGNVDIYIDVGLMALMNRTITVESATIEKVQLEIERLEDGRMRFGSLVLDQSTESDWLINLRQLRITNSEVHYISPELTTTLNVNFAGVDRVYTGFSKEHGDITLEGSLDGAPINVAVAFNVNPGISLHGTAKVGSLKLEPLAELVKEQIHELDGVVNLDGDIALTIDTPDQPISAKYDGSVSLAGIALDNQDLSVSSQSFGWQGTVAFDVEKQNHIVGLEGKLSVNELFVQSAKQAINATQGQMGVEAKGITLKITPDDFDLSGNIALSASDTEIKKSETGAQLFSLSRLVMNDVEFGSIMNVTVPSVELTGIKASNPKSPDKAMVLNSLALKSVHVADFTDVEIGEVRTTQFQVIDQARDSILAQLSDLSITNVTASVAQRASIETISLGEISLLSKLSDPKAPPLGRIGNTEVSLVTYTPDGLTLDVIKVNGFKVNVVRQQRTKESVPSQSAKDGAADADDRVSAKVRSAQSTERAQDDDVFKFNIGELELTGDSLIYLEDRAVHPPFRLPIRISKLKLSSRDREQTFGPMDLTLKGGLGEHGTVEADGMIDPSAQAFDMKLRIDDVNMIGLSPYTVRMMGYQVDSGHLTLDSSIRITDGLIDAQNNMLLRELYMNKASEEIAAEAEEEVGMPIEKALKLLRDKRGNIDLDVPISGELVDMRVGMGDVIGTALLSALGSTTYDYLKLVNLPYGVALGALERLRKEVKKIRIDPVEYEAGKSELPVDATKVVTQVATRLKKDAKLDVRLCPSATSEDLAVIGGKPVEGDPAKDLVDKMFLLGHDRAAKIKRNLISQHDIDPGRVVVCVTKYDKKKGAKPRVKFVF